MKLSNLRKVLLVSYEDFLQRFFQVQDAQEKDTTQTRQYNLRVFKLTVQTQQKIKDRQLDPFVVMEAELKDLNACGIQPIIIIDELQALDFIYFNSQRELIKELINFFVAMTKESHLCHVLLSSSDGYFIEKLYNDSKLKKTSELFEVDYLPQEDIVYWLNNLDTESKIREFTLTTQQIEYLWEHFGGSIWEISNESFGAQQFFVLQSDPGPVQAAGQEHGDRAFAVCAGGESAAMSMEDLACSTPVVGLDIVGNGDKDQTLGFVLFTGSGSEPPWGYLHLQKIFSFH